MLDHSAKSYGRNREVEAIYKWFNDGRDISMPGPRRLGKTFVLDRLVDNGPKKGWHAVKIELAGCTDTRTVFRRLCEAIGRNRTGGANAISWFKQRLGQVLTPRGDQGGAWYQPLLSLDHETWFERLVRAMDEDKERRWALLIDELPIFLKALHDRGPEGVLQALAFMNLLNQLRDKYPRVRWLITGSIGIEPLARAGNYLGALAKFTVFELDTLSIDEAKSYVQDLAAMGRLSARSRITDAEAAALVEATGWRTAYYLDAVAQKMSGSPTASAEEAQAAVEQAVQKLLQPVQGATFGTWEEHIQKHYPDPDRGIAFDILNTLAPSPQSLRIDAMLTIIGRSDLTHAKLRAVASRLHTEGFVTLSDWEGADPTCAFRNPLLRRWWQRFPHAN
ncbi:MAG TPA: hypothetical protein VK195_20640 [Burkholderiaceae bacterium]|nr:hypothetical protein [Burkholderiaceae bacterium]